MSACLICGGLVPPPKKRGQAPRYCSDACRLVARGNARERLRDQQPGLVKERNRIKQSKWRSNNPDTFRAYRKKHYARNKQRILEQRKRVRKPERERELARERYRRNREHIRAQMAARRQRDDVREKARKATEQWRLANPEWAKANNYRSFARWRARRLEAFVEHVDPLVVFERDKGVCMICSLPVDRAGAWEIDHKVPLSKGGEHSYANTQLAHRSCNRSKGARVAS